MAQVPASFLETSDSGIDESPHHAYISGAEGEEPKGPDASYNLDPAYTSLKPEDEMKGVSDENIEKVQKTP